MQWKIIRKTRFLFLDKVTVDSMVVREIDTGISRITCDTKERRRQKKNSPKGSKTFYWQCWVNNLLHLTLFQFDELMERENFLLLVTEFVVFVMNLLLFPVANSIRRVWVDGRHLSLMSETRQNCYKKTHLVNLSHFRAWINTHKAIERIKGRR